MSYPMRAALSVLLALVLGPGALGVAAAQAQAQAQSTLPDPKAARALTDTIMAKVGGGDIEGGMRLMGPYLGIPASEFETTIGQAKQQAPVMAQRFGKSIGSEFLKEDRAGTRLLRIQQLQLFEQHAARWTFYFYRTPRGWILNTFVFNDDIKTFFP